MEATKVISPGFDSLYSCFGGLKDPRRAQGCRYPLPLILILVMIPIMSGYTGQRAMSDFIKRHKEELRKLFAIKRDALPSRRTITDVFELIDFEALSEAFRNWFSDSLLSDEEWIAIDGKVIGGTVADAKNKYQSYVSLVSLFSHHQKQVVSCGTLRGDKESEIAVALSLIEKCGLKNKIFTMDALHCQKETTKTIVDGGNDYVIGVKENQPNLLKALKKRA